MNYFKLFNLELQYDIDLNLLKERYLELQIKYHPDKCSILEEKQRNLNFTMDINNAYNTLKNDILRAEYLLKINNISIQDSTNIPKDLLEKILEEQEKLENIEDIGALKVFNNKKTQAYKNFIVRLNNAFKNNNLKEALDIFISLKYLTKLLENVKLKIKYANNRNLRT